MLKIKIILNKLKKYPHYLFIGGTIILMSIVFSSSLYYLDQKDNTVKNGYFAVFRGEYNNDIYSTYVYLHKKKNKKVEYKYINTKIITNQYDDINSIEKVTKKGTLKKKKQIFKTAEDNNAYSYVIWLKNYKIYNIVEFKEAFLK